MVVGLSRVFPPEGVCKGCILGKHHQEPFNSRQVWQVKNLLELVHYDVCLVNLPSLAHARYTLTFIDDFSHFTWVFFFMNKKHVFDKFK
jgi:hypothetical protein